MLTTKCGMRTCFVVPNSRRDAAPQTPAIDAIVFSNRDLRQPEGSLPVAAAFHERTVMIPWFKHHRPETIEQHAAAYRKWR
ncbi:MAG: hypothetical protein KAI66_15760 [Lentisphaeria bacterium]|nr:hypothetical protein [Lentisphaeria bacterium]